MKKQFKLQLFDNAPKCAQAVILTAAKSNGSISPSSLQELAEYGKAYNEKADFVPTQFEIVGENKLHIDSLISDKWECVAIIEEVEVFEIIHVSNDLVDTIF
jgi:hypothetical protein